MLKKVVSKEKSSSKEVKSGSKANLKYSAAEGNLEKEGSKGDLTNGNAANGEVAEDEHEQLQISKSDLNLLRKYGFISGDANTIWSYLKSGMFTGDCRVDGMTRK
jgi:hypothetical protein